MASSNTPPEGARGCRCDGWKSGPFVEIDTGLSSPTTLDDDNFDFGVSFSSEATDYHFGCTQIPGDQLFYSGRFLPLQSIPGSPTTVDGSSERRHSPSPSFDGFVRKLVATENAYDCIHQTDDQNYNLPNSASHAESVGSSTLLRRKTPKVWNAINGCCQPPSTKVCGENNPQLGRKQNHLPTHTEFVTERVQSIHDDHHIISKKPPKGIKSLFRGFQAKKSVRSTGNQHQEQQPKQDACAVVRSEKKSTQAEWLRKMLRHPFGAWIKSSGKGGGEAAGRASGPETSGGNIKASSWPSSPAPNWRPTTSPSNVSMIARNLSGDCSVQGAIAHCKKSLTGGSGKNA